jgi:hypothetical protein
MKDKVKIFGAVLVILGMISMVCFLYISTHLSDPSLDIVHRVGWLQGVAISQVVIGTILVSPILED